MAVKPGAGPRGAQSLLALGGLFLIALVAAFRPLRDFDLPWHLSLGRSLVRHRAIPEVDTLAFTHGTLAYLELVGDSFLFGVVSAFGERGLGLVGALASVTMLLFVYARLLPERTLGLVAAALVALAVVPWLEVRPATLSFGLVSLVLFVIDRHRRVPVDVRPLIALIPLYLVWANVHGFVALGVLLLSGYAAHCGLARVLRGRAGALLPAEHGARAPAVAAVALLSAAAASVNTIGPSLLLGPFRLDERLAPISEWARPTLAFFLHDEPIASSLLLLSLAAFAVGREPSGRRTPPLFDIGLALVAIGGALSVVRLLPVAVLVLLPLAVRRIEAFVPRTPLVAWVSAALPLAAALGLSLRVPLALEPGFDPTFLPVDAVRFVKEKKPAGRMYNFWPFGGYLGWTLDQPVFMDGRNQLARDRSLLVRADRARQDPAAFAALDREYRFEWAVTTAREGEGHDLPLARSKDFTLVYLDDLAAVYVKERGVNRELSASGYRLLRHLTPPEQVLHALLEGGPELSDLAHDGALAGRQAPTSPRAAFLEACGGIAAEDARAFRRARTRLARLLPGHPALGVLDEIAKGRGLAP